MKYMNIERNISIKSIEYNDAEQLVEIMNTDKVLKCALCSNENEISIEEFIQHNRKWSSSRKADMFAIVYNGAAIGVISLSHQNFEEKKAQIGYWIGSKYWGKTCTTQAFSNVLEFARKKGFKYVTASIKSDNFASKRIWEKQGAKIEFDNSRFNVKLCIDSNLR